MSFNIIAAILENLAREIFIDRFDFLQQHNVGHGLVQPLGQGRNPGLDPVDIECGDFHAAALCVVWSVVPDGAAQFNGVDRIRLVAIVTIMSDHITIVLGAAVKPDGHASPTLARRARAGAEHWHTVGGIIVLTGGTGLYPPSEAEAAASICMDLGVPMTAISLEVRSRNTFENIAETRCLYPDLSHRSVTLVSDRWHLPRARLIAQIVGIQTRGFPAKSGKVSRSILAIARELIATPLSVLRAIRHKG